MKIIDQSPVESINYQAKWSLETTQKNKAKPKSQTSRKTET